MQHPENPMTPQTSLSFESLKLHNEHGVEYWSARDLMPCLGYSQWRSFENAIQKAIESCKQSGNNPEHHLAGARKLIIKGKGASQELNNYHLSRFACYLIAQNGDPRKEEIAHAQKYFAIQTRRQEVSEQVAADMERLETRQQASMEFKALSGAAREAGVQDKMFGMFHDAGYKGLYGGLGVDAIKARKGIAPKEQLMDRMGRTELFANLFRMTQTQDKLKNERIKDPREAMQAHEMVGKKVRTAIEEIGGVLPENIPPAEPIKTVEKRLKTATPRLTLDPKDALGVLSPDSIKETV
jgi:DNA-damage-inducible protein D